MGILTALQVGRTRSPSSRPGSGPVRGEIFVFPKAQRPSMGPTQSPSQWVPASRDNFLITRKRCVIFHFKIISLLFIPGYS